jgi:hypothetical protein
MRESPRVAGSTSDIYVIGNNPLNMLHFGGPGQAWLAGGGHYKVAVFPTQDAAIKAFSNNINSNAHGYPDIVKAFKTSPNDPIRIIKAINNSGWVTGKTGGHSYIYKGGVNGLLNTYNGIGGNDVLIPYTPPASTPANFLEAWKGAGIAYPVGHVLTTADVNDIITKLDAAGYFDNPDAKKNGVPDLTHDAALNTTKQILMSHVGQQWNKSLQDTLQKEFGVAANNAVPNPVNIVFQPFAFLAGKALAIGAISIGIVLAGFGAYLVVKDVYSGSGSGGGMLDVTPIIIRN